MKKGFVIALIITLLLVGLTLAFNENFDGSQVFENSSTNETNGHVTLNTGSGMAGCQQFRIGGVGQNVKFNLTGVSFAIQRTSNIEWIMVNISTSDTSGHALSELSLNRTVNISDVSIINAGHQWINVSMPQVNLSQDTNYTLCVINNQSDVLEWGGSLITTNPYKFGFNYREKEGVYTDWSQQDRTFKIWGSPVSELIVTNVWPSDTETLNFSQVNMTYNVTTINNLENCSLIIDGMINTSNTSTVFTDINQTFNVTFDDGSYDWRVQCRSDQGTYANTSEWSFTVDTIPVSIDLDMLTVEHQPIDLNFTVDTGYDTCVYWTNNNSASNTTITNCDNTTISLNPDTYTIHVWANDSGGNTANDSQSIAVIEFVERYDNQTIERGTANISISILKPDEVTVEASLTFNNTNQSNIIKNADSNATFYKIVDAPESTWNSTNISFFWNISATYTDLSITNYAITNTSSNVSVHRMSLTDCTDASFTTTRTVNYTISDELTNAAINGTAFNTTIEHLYEARPNSTSSFSRLFSFDTNLSSKHYSSTEICIFPTWANLSVDVTAIYDADGYNQRGYSLQETQLTNITSNVTLLLLALGNQNNVTVNVVDQNSDPIENLTVKAFKYNLGGNNYTLVESGETDFAGNVIMKLQGGTTEYKFEFWDGGDLIDTKFNINIPADNELDFQIILGVERTEEVLIDVKSGITHSLTWDNSTRLVTWTWNDVDDFMTQSCLQISQMNLTANLTVVTNCSSSKSSSVTYYINNNSTDTYHAFGYVIAQEDDNKYILQELQIDLRANKFKFGELGIALAFLIIVALALVGAGTGSPMVTLLLTMIGFIVTAILQLMPLGATTVMGIIVFTIIIAIARAKR